MRRDKDKLGREGLVGQLESFSNPLPFRLDSLRKLRELLGYGRALKVAEEDKRKAGRFPDGAARFFQSG